MQLTLCCDKKQFVSLHSKCTFKITYDFQQVLWPTQKLLFPMGNDFNFIVLTKIKKRVRVLVY
uniref:Uncharacterized protein n=1 Tax=Vibrio tasmaniensis TaxID=212663 RepID=A0A0H3ZML2_9VIBR|nr:hypothetical protein [Vibrio tasmaniensis]